MLAYIDDIGYTINAEGEHGVLRSTETALDIDMFHHALTSDRYHRIVAFAMPPIKKTTSCASLE